MILQSGQTFTLSELLSCEPVVISWIGGSYGNFLYRTIHRFINGFPNLNDNGEFTLNGSSHQSFEYIQDIRNNRNQTKFRILYTIEGERFVVKKHSASKFTPTFPFKKEKPFLHIKIIFRDQAAYIWATIQNLLKRPSVLEMYPDSLSNINWLESDKKDLESICSDINELIRSTNKLWFQKEEGFYCIYMDELFDQDLFWNHLEEIAKNCNLNTKNKEEFALWHENFLSNQKLLKSYLNHINKTYDNLIFVDKLLQIYQ